MPKSTEKIDLLFTSLADATRRQVVERLGSGPATVSELAEPFEMALPSFVQHLSVLERSGLVQSSKEGRVRTYSIVPKRLKAVEKWMKSQRSSWKKAKIK